MNNFGKLAGAALISALGLMPVQATTIPQFGELLQLIDFPPGQLLNTEAMYGNIAGNFNNVPGITYTSNDPNAVLTYSPNPELQSGGLLSGTLGLAGGAATGSASGSLATGTTHVLSTTSYVNGVSESNVSTIIGMLDGLTFHVAGGGSANVTMTYVLDGSLGTTNSVESSYNSEIEYFIGSAQMVWTGQMDPNFSQVGTASTTGFDSFTYTNPTISGFQFQGTFAVTDGESANLSFRQTMNCNNGEICDFSNTGQMGLILPTGVSFTSDSGVFLTQSENSAVPEPGSFLLIGMGIAALGCCGRRRFARQA